MGFDQDIKLVHNSIAVILVYNTINEVSMTFPSKVFVFDFSIMDLVKKGRGHDFYNCRAGSECWYRSKLVISGVKRFLARSATIIPFGTLLTHKLNVF